MTELPREDFVLCKLCKELKPLSAFSHYTYDRPQRRLQCKPCYSKLQGPKAKKRYEEKKEEIMAQRRASMAERKAAGYVPLPRIRKNMEEYSARKKVTTLARTSGLRTQTFNIYGGCFCACCGESRPLFLSLDHIEGNGNKHRKETGTAGGQKFYRHLRGLGYPPGYQVLCMNCNTGRYRNGGICPHKDPK